jgi:predicted nucleic acid-binding protein
MIVWWGTPLEVRSALARLVREGQLVSDDRTRAVDLMTRLREAWDEILPSEKVRSLAEDMPDTHGLRAADAAQLAAALVWCKERPKGRAFVCFDQRLRTAASTLGFSVRP